MSNEPSNLINSPVLSGYYDCRTYWCHVLCFCLFTEKHKSRKSNVEERVKYIEKCAEHLNKLYSAGTVELNYTEGQHNMKETIDTVPFMTDYALQAMKEADITPKTLSIRGGSDGVVLCSKGLPCPNISAEYENEISRFEFVPIQSMEKNVEVLLNLVKLYGKHSR